MKICFIDTYYPDFLKTLTLGNGTYQQELDKVLARQFGTSDFYSREFRKIGWEAIDIVANYAPLQSIWRRENGIVIDGAQTTAMLQIERFKPDVVFVQDLSLFSSFHLKQLRHNCLLVAQCSCELPDLDKVRQFHTIFTSFPHYVPKLQALGVNAVYMPLAFHESCLSNPVPELSRVIEDEFVHVEFRDIDVSFVGGIGRQWTYGREVLEAVAREIPTAQFYGYGYGSLPDSSPLKAKYKGPAWGDEMYRIYQRSKIVINRHGEIAGDYANNMRMYEATGCGALLVTERKRNICELFSETDIFQYSDANQAVAIIRDIIKFGVNFGVNAQKRTLSDHTYAHRIPRIAEVLEKAMVSA